MSGSCSGCSTPCRGHQRPEKATAEQAVQVIAMFMNDPHGGAKLRALMKNACLQTLFDLPPDQLAVLERDSFEAALKGLVRAKAGAGAPT